eukprot:SAG31_NODE_65_length_28565_cov_8.402914_10_plen_42_part_00
MAFFIQTVDRLGLAGAAGADGFSFTGSSGQVCSQLIPINPN